MLTAGMELLVDFFQPRLVDVGVNLRRRDIGMAQQFLDLTQVGSPGKHMRGKAVPHRMRADRNIDVCQQGIFLHNGPNRFTTQSFAATGKKKVPRVISV